MQHLSDSNIGFGSGFKIILDKQYLCKLRQLLLLSTGRSRDESVLVSHMHKRDLF